MRRALPRRARRTVGAWCFVDHMGPARSPTEHGARHRAAPPHRAADGHLAARRRGPAPRQPRLRAGDPARPAQPHDRRARRVPRRGGDRPLRGRAARRAALGGPAGRRPATARRPSSTTPSCPQVELGARRPPPCWSATLAGAASPARRDTDHVGVDLDLRPGAPTLPLEPALRARPRRARRRASTVERQRSSSPGSSPTSAPAATSWGSSPRTPARALLIGGVPFAEPIADVVELRGPHPRRDQPPRTTTGWPATTASAPSHRRSTASTSASRRGRADRRVPAAGSPSEGRACRSAQAGPSEGDQRPTAFSSSALFILERPSMPLSLASL